MRTGRFREGSIERIGVGAAGLAETEAIVAVEQVMPHPAVVAILVRLAALGIGHHVHEVVPIVLGQARISQLVCERQRRRPKVAGTVAPSAK